MLYAKLLQLCLTLCDPLDYSPPGSSFHGILQARLLEWVPISFSRGSSWPSDWTQVSCIVGRLLNDWATDSLGVPGKPLNHCNYVYQEKSGEKEKSEVIQQGVWCRLLLVTALTSFLGGCLWASLLTGVLAFSLLSLLPTPSDSTL